jgi:hypothetical protein
VRPFSYVILSAAKNLSARSFTAFRVTTAAGLQHGTGIALFWFEKIGGVARTAGVIRKAPTVFF